MKKVVLAFGIPVLAVASLIGSGYATWYFNNSVKPDDRTIALELKEKKVVGAKFQHPEENIKLVLDQTDKSKEDGMPNDRKGVHFEGTFSESLIADDGDPTNGEDKFVNGISYNVTTTITIPSEVAKYVDFTFNGATSSTDSLTNSLTLTKLTKLDVTDKPTSSFDVFKIADVTVAYAEGKEPTTSDAYENMKTAVTGKTIGISFAAEIAVNK